MRVRLRRDVLTRAISASRMSQNRWALRIGVSRGYLSLLVNGKRRYPSKQTRDKLLQALDLSFEELFETVKSDRKLHGGMMPTSSGHPAPRVELAPGQRVGGRMSGVWQDIRWAIKHLLSKPGYTAVAVMSLGLGLWGATALFSVVDSIFLRRLPFADPERIVALSEVYSRGFELTSLSSVEYFHLEHSGVFEALAAYVGTSRILTGQGDAIMLRGAAVTPELFYVLGVTPWLGAFFESEDRTQLSEDQVVLSHGLWAGRFGADAGVIGQTATLDGRTLQIIGVAPPDFQFPVGANAVDFWVPFAVNRGGTGHNKVVVARLSPDNDIERSRRRVGEILGAVEGLHRSDESFQFKLTTVHERAVGTYRSIFTILLCCVGAVLLIGSVNAAGLQLAMAFERRRELALRRALGARMTRLARQLLAESVLLACTGGLLGVILTYFSLDLLVSISPTNIPRLDQVTIDWRVIAVALSLSVATGVLFGAAPALGAARPDIASSLRLGASFHTGSVSRTRDGLVVAQIMLAMMLIVGAGLTARSLHNLLNVDPGVDSSKVLSFRLGLDHPKYRGDASLQFLELLLKELSALPGVEGATIASSIPLEGGTIHYGFKRRQDPEAQSGAGMYFVGPDYLAVMGVPLIRGRNVRESDRRDAAPVVLINQSMARRYWPDQNPVGDSFTVEGEREPRQIVGVVADIKRSRLEEDSSPEMNLPFAQAPFYQLVSPAVLVRSSAAPMPLVPSVRRLLRSFDPDLPMIRVRTLDTVRMESLAHPRFRSFLLGSFAVFSLVLATVGLLALISHQMGRRIREFGIRLALGARPDEIITLVLRRAASLALAGIALGLVGSLATSRWLESFLFGVSPTDWATLLATPILLMLAALAACFFPANQAARVDPATTLRCD